MGMDRSPVGTWLMRVRTVSRISACRWLKAAMLLCTAVMWPSVSFSKDTRPSYCSSPFSMASYTASLTMRVTVLDTRVVAMLSSRGRIWVAAMKSTVSARADQQKRQGPQHPPAVHPPAVEVKSAPDHGHHAPFPPLYAGAAWPYFRAFTRSLKTRPRSMKLANRSKEVLAGDSSTTSPGRAVSRASATADW